jgi:hypothetical protein
MPRYQASVLLFTAALIQLSAVQAQNQLPAQPVVELSTYDASNNGTALVMQRIVDECHINDGCPPVPVNYRTVSLQIPDFTPGDEERHVYVLANIRESGSGAGTVFADENGILEKQEGFIPSSLGGNVPEAEPQYYFVSVDVATLDARFTLDLHQVNLVPLLKSLQSAEQMGKRAATRSQGFPRTDRSNMQDLLHYRELTLSIQGEHLTLDEVLDAIYLASGCIVDQDGETLVVASCP